MSKIIITTENLLNQPYEVVGLVYFQVRNSGKPYRELMKDYKPALDEMRRLEKMPNTPKGFFNWTGSELEECFFVGQEEIKKRASILGANAVIGFREDTDIYNDGGGWFFMQMYGTAVRFL